MKIDKLLKIGCIGAGAAGVGHMVSFEKYLPGCCVAFSDLDRKLFDQIMGSYVDGCVDPYLGDFSFSGGQFRKELKNLPYYSDPDEMLDSEDINTVIIATYCNAHAEMLEKCVKRGVNIILEKPIAINADDVERVWTLLKNYPHTCTVNFSLRGAPVTQSVRNHILNGSIGRLVSIQYTNNVHYGDGYFRKWMRTRDSIGNLLLQKATHDFDVINYVTGLKPVKIAAFGSRLVYGGNMPNELTCDDCKMKWSCKMSLYRRQLDAGKPLPPKHLRLCPYAKQIDIDDNNTSIISYEGGVTASYCQTFNVPTRAASRGAVFVGTEGVLRFDYYGDFVESPRGETLVGNSVIELWRHDAKPGTKIREVYDWGGTGHFGSNDYMALARIDVLNGRENHIAGSIEDGYISARMCLAAQESVETGQILDVLPAEFFCSKPTALKRI